MVVTYSRQRDWILPLLLLLVLTATLLVGLWNASETRDLKQQALTNSAATCLAVDELRMIAISDRRDDIDALRADLADLQSSLVFLTSLPKAPPGVHPYIAEKQQAVSSKHEAIREKEQALDRSLDLVRSGQPC